MGGKKHTLTMLWTVAGLLAAGAAVVAVIKVWPLLNPEVASFAEPDPSCDLREGPCRARFPDGGSVELAIEPRYLPPLKPLQLRVTVEGVEPEGAVEVDIAGLNMNMGYNRPVLEPRGDGVFAGTATIPVCVKDRMDWEARVLLRTGEGLLAAPFRFATYREHAYR